MEIGTLLRKELHCTSSVKNNEYTKECNTFDRMDTKIVMKRRFMLLTIKRNQEFQLQDKVYQFIVQLTTLLLGAKSENIVKVVFNTTIKINGI